MSPIFDAEGDDAPPITADAVALRLWVEDLVETYELADVVPECWEQHTGVVRELAAIFEGSLDELPKGGMRAVAWHEALAKLLERLAARPAGRCAKHGGHRAPPVWPSVETARLAERLGTDPSEGKWVP